jgi:ABC-type tungstate transport system permease subunit
VVFSRVGLLFLLCLALPARAQEVREFTLSAAPEIVESGLLDYIMPRFALKTGRRGTLVDDGADLRLGADEDGAPVMVRGDAAYTIVLATDNDAAQRFADWLQSDIGQNTLTAFEPAEGPSFAAAAAMAEAEEIAFEGDAELGREVAETHCARCHRVTAETTRMGIGSTLSFGALKALPKD